MAKMVATIRRAIKRSEQTRYRIAKGSGVSQAQLSRLVSGEQGMSAANLERVAEFLGLEIVIRPKRKRKGR